ncbi:MAG: hypothetical protein ACK4JE_03840 [Endomicrobiia bacterium]
MIELTPEQRRKIYEEEKLKIEGEEISPIGGLILANIFAISFLFLLVSISKKKFYPKIEDIRKAYEGFDSE